MKCYLKIINGKKYVCFKERKNSSVEIRFEYPDKIEFSKYTLGMFLGSECVVYDKEIPIAELKIKCDTEILHVNKVFPCDFLIDFIEFISGIEYIPKQLIFEYHGGAKFDMVVTVNTWYDDERKCDYFEFNSIERKG